MAEKDETISCVVLNESSDDSSKKPAEIKADGLFNRQTNRFTTPFGTILKSYLLRLGAIACFGRLHVLGHTALVIVRKILGLENAISLGKVSPMRPRIERVDW